jgi:hypothetical protein
VVLQISSERPPHHLEPDETFGDPKFYGDRMNLPGFVVSAQPTFT